MPFQSTSAKPARLTGPLGHLIAAQKNGIPLGMYSVCSAHPLVLEAVMRHAARDQRPVLIEATANQVNQYGGYTGQKPQQFFDWMHSMAAEMSLSADQLILGGDHLGPLVWQSEPADQAMPKAIELVRDYASAGFTKIHLDASMPLGDDPPGPIDPALSARRAAEMARAAEQASNGRPITYVIGTEVPIPGGAQSADELLEVTTVENARETIEVSRQAFVEAGLDDAWQRVIALVVQPGVEFGHSEIHEYRPEAARDLSRFIEGVPGLIYEAHSTDYQTVSALRQLVADHFAILKVGPGLTFALREGLFALEQIEVELLPESQRSRLSEVLEAVMLAYPGQWQKYYLGDFSKQRQARRFSMSDRIRYYWPDPTVQAAVKNLMDNLSSMQVPLTLVSQHLPQQYTRIRNGELSMTPKDWVIDKIDAVLRDYSTACYPDYA